jgi:anti-repressor protein
MKIIKNEKYGDVWYVNIEGENYFGAACFLKSLNLPVDEKELDKCDADGIKVIDGKKYLNSKNVWILINYANANFATQTSFGGWLCDQGFLKKEPTTEVSLINNRIQIWEHEEFGEIRSVKIGDEIYFVGKDVAVALGYTNTKFAVKNYVDPVDRQKMQLSDFHVGSEMNPYVNQEITIINESGVYALIFGSKLPKAKEFTHWVTSVVLPSIRKTGGYIHVEKDMTDDEIMARALKVADATIERIKKEREELILKNKTQEKILEEQKPKVVLADAVTASKDSILVREMAIILKQNGIDTGQNKLYGWLRKNNLCCSQSGSWNQPTQKAMNSKFFEIHKTVVNENTQHPKIVTTTKITGIGQQYLINEFLYGEKYQKA